MYKLNVGKSLASFSTHFAERANHRIDKNKGSGAKNISTEKASPVTRKDKKKEQYHEQLYLRHQHASKVR